MLLLTVFGDEFSEKNATKQFRMISFEFVVYKQYVGYSSICSEETRIILECVFVSEQIVLIKKSKTTSD